MTEPRPLILLLLVTISLTLSCGGGGGRQLRSISLSQTVNGEQVQFVATGTFSAPPMTVTPLPVMWGVQLYAPQPSDLEYTLTSQPYVFNCSPLGSEGGPVSAIAPSDPNASASGSQPFSKMVLAYATVNCP
jgi:hypothetical protein